MSVPGRKKGQDFGQVCKVDSRRMVKPLPSRKMPAPYPHPSEEHLGIVALGVVFFVMRGYAV